MKRIILQAGHENIKNNCVASLRGSTGAGGEVEINIAVRDEVARLLAGKVEVKKVDGNFNCDPTSLDEDWDLFLTIHCDMDYAGDNGSGFCDFPEPSTDDATKESQRCAKAIQDYFFPKVGINVKSRSNANTRYYYMWQCISAKTPCVLIEMGQVKDSHDSVILKDTARVGKALAEAILVALGLPVEDTCQKELEEMRESRNKWKAKYEELDRESTKDLQAKIKHIEELQKTVAELNSWIALNTSSQESYVKDIEALKKELAESRKECQESQEAINEAHKENERLSVLLNKCQDKEVETTMKNPIFEAVKEPLRLLVLAVIPFGVAYFTSLSYEWAGVAVLILRLIDKLLHEVGKAKENESLTLGLVRF